MSIKQFDVTDVTAVNITFVSNRAHNVTDFNAISAAHFNAVQFHITHVTAFTARTITTLRTIAETVVTVIAAAIITIVELAARTAWWPTCGTSSGWCRRVPDARIGALTPESPPIGADGARGGARHRKFRHDPQWHRNPPFTPQFWGTT